MSLIYKMEKYYAKKIIVDTYDFDAFKMLLKKDKNSRVQPFYVVLSNEEYKSLRFREKRFLKYNYVKEGEHVYTNYVVFIDEGNNPIKDYYSFLLVDEKTFKIVSKLEIISSETIEEKDTGLVMERYLVRVKGRVEYYTLRKILSYLPIDKYIEINDKIETK